MSLAGRHNISGYDRLPLSPEQIEAFLSELSRSHFQSEKRLKDHKTSSDAQLEAKREAMSKLRSQASEGRAQSNSLKQQIVSTRCFRLFACAQITDVKVLPLDSKTLRRSRAPCRPRSRAAR